MTNIKELVTQLGSNNPAQAHAARQALRDIVWRAADPDYEKDQLEISAAFGEQLAADHEALVKAELCELLGLIGSGENVPALVELMSDESTREMARRTLARIPGEAAAKALAATTRTGTPAKFRVGAVNSLAGRREPEAIAALIGALKSDDLEVRLAAAEALARGQQPDFDPMIAEVDTAGSDRAKCRIAAARLRLAENLAQSGNKAAAQTIYKRISVDGAPEPQRTAAQRALQTLG